MISLAILSLALPVVRALSSYVPVSAACPASPLIRPADGLSDSEEAYRVARKAVADESLKAWLLKTNPDFGTDELPTVALSISGGGYRALLTGAGIIQGFDERDSSVSTSGLYQGLTYQAALSGGGWLLSSMAGNNFPTITYLKDTFWKQAFLDSIFDPDSLLAPIAFIDITEDVVEKEAAGFPTTITDPWGRLLSYQLLPGSDGGAGITLSSVTKLSNFTTHAVPYPILLSQGVKTWLGECAPLANASTYELTPYEFGSWDNDISAFTPTQYLGTSLYDGVPTGSCTVNLDNLGFVLGTSSNVFSEVCISAPGPDSGVSTITKTVIDILDEVHEILTSDLYAEYRNPFFGYRSPTGFVNSANNISGQSTLSLTDGGISGQDNPIFPFLLPARNVSALIVNDNSGDSNNYPDGASMVATYVQSFNHNYTRMPFIPPVTTFVAEGLNKRATFFGCDDPSKVTIVYLPNTNFTFSSNVEILQLEYSESETDAMIANGVQVADQGGEAGWGTCLGCALMMNTGQALPSACTTCFQKYCYYNS